MEQEPNQPAEFDSADDDIFSTGVATLDCEPSPTEPACEKCQQPLPSAMVTICPHCGWYPNLGTFLEVDPDWETALTGDDSAEPPAPKPNLGQHLQVWMILLPAWSWLIIGCVTGVVVESIVARLITSPEGGMRTIWSLTQLAIGATAFTACHLFAFLLAVAEDADFGVMDLVLKPFKVWARLLRQLPQWLSVANTAACGLMAMLMSILVIGAIPYYILFDWGFEERAKPDLMGAVMSQIQELEGEGGSGSLEDAVNDFAGTQNLEESEPPPPPKAKPRQRTDCVVLGYRATEEGAMRWLIIGTVKSGRIVYAGKVVPELDEEDMVELLADLEAARSRRPLIPLQLSGTWVEAKFSCRVSYTEREKSGRLKEIKWVKMLSTMSM